MHSCKKTTILKYLKEHAQYVSIYYEENHNMINEISIRYEDYGLIIKFEVMSRFMDFEIKEIDNASSNDELGKRMDYCLKNEEWENYFSHSLSLFYISSYTICLFVSFSISCLIFSYTL